MNINISEAATNALLENGLNESCFLRLGVKPGGCAGMSYAAEVDDQLGPGDEVVYEAGKLRIVAASMDSQYIDGLEIDFSNDLVRPGFILKNPNAQEGCGCGSSFKTECATTGGCGS